MSFTQREARSIIRKAVARVPEGEEIRHLNIMPMMDMMTILLVFLIQNFAQSSAANVVQSDELADEVTADLTGTEDDVAAHAALARWNP